MATIRGRGYQYEMFERSMKENVIVAVRFVAIVQLENETTDFPIQMDTGSGKTHMFVAIGLAKYIL
jgi:hypothetical protein